ncbi:hypothetical protein QTP88_008046 [Uroleucon formosanum]
MCWIGFKKTSRCGGVVIYTSLHCRRDYKSRNLFFDAVVVCHTVDSARMRLTFASVYANPDVPCAHALNKTRERETAAFGSVGDPLHQGGRRWGDRCDPTQGNLRFRSVLAASSSVTLAVVAAAACVQYRSLRNRPIKTAKVTRVSPL